MHNPSNLEVRFAKIFFGPGSRRELYEQLASLVESGLSISEALHMSWDVASVEGKKPRENKAIAISHIIRSMRNGETFSSALAPWVPKEDSMAIEAVERSSNFSGNMREYLTMVDKRRKIRNTILGGIPYPIFLVAALFAVIYIFGKRGIPIIAESAPMDQWTGPALGLKYMSDFSEHYLVQFVGLLILIIAAILFSLPRWSANGRRIADKMPIFSIYRIYTGVSFLMSMAALIQSGMTHLQALDRLHNRASPYVRYRIRAIRNQMLGGSSFSSALHRTGLGWPDQKMNLSIKIYGQSQDLSRHLTRMSRTWADETQASVEKSMSLFRVLAITAIFMTVLMILGGVVVLQTQMSASMSY